MPIPYTFNPLGAGNKSTGNDFIQPILLSDTVIDTSVPYSFGMAITDNYGQTTAWQAFDGSASTAWLFTVVPIKMKIEFEHPIVLEKLELQWKGYANLFILSTVDGRTLFTKSGTAAHASEFTLSTPTTVNGLIFDFSNILNDSGLYSIKFIGKCAT